MQADLSGTIVLLFNDREILDAQSSSWFSFSPDWAQRTVEDYWERETLTDAFLVHLNAAFNVIRGTQRRFRTTDLPPSSVPRSHARNFRALSQISTKSRDAGPDQWSHLDWEEENA